MQLKWLLSLFLFWYIPINVFSQESKRDNIWMICNYGTDNAGIDFNPGFADTFYLQRDMRMYLTNGSICDTNGQLLFYTNGHYIADKLHNPMVNTSGFNPGYITTLYYPYGHAALQGVLILPIPEHSDQFVIFHESGDTFTAHNEHFQRPLNLSYTKVDMSIGSGIVTDKNVHIIDDTLLVGRLMACKHANGRDWWIIKHKLFTNEFVKILLTPDTIMQFDVQAIGSYTEYEDALGGSIFSHDGNKYVHLNYDSTVDILDFDRRTGEFSNLITFGCPDSTYATLGCALSSSGRFLYINTNQHIFQYDMWNANIASTRVVVATYDGQPDSNGVSTQFFSMRLAPDNKIYLSTYNGSYQIHVIDYPDSAGLACNVRQHGFILQSYNAFAFPNAVNYSLEALGGSPCDTLGYPNLVQAIEKPSAVLSIFYHSQWQTTFINANGLKGRNYSLHIIGIEGKIVFEESGSLNSEYFTKNFHCNHIASGTYLVLFETENERLVRKLMIE